MEQIRKTRSTILLVICTVVVLLLAGIMVVRPTLSMTCSKALENGRAQQLWQDSQVARQAIDNLQREVTLRFDDTKCQGKAFLHIEYDTQDTRNKVQEIIAGSKLKALPVEWQNI